MSWVSIPNSYLEYCIQCNELYSSSLRESTTISHEKNQYIAFQGPIEEEVEKLQEKEPSKMLEPLISQPKSLAVRI